MFEQMIGVGGPQPPERGEPGEPQQAASPGGDFASALYAADAAFDVDRPAARDLMAEAMDGVLAQIFQRIDQRKRFDAFYLSDEDSPETAFGLPPVDYAQNLDVSQFPNDAATVGAFERYMPSGAPPATGYTPGSPIPLQPDTFNPIKAAVEPPFSSLSRGGYSEAITDPSGELMRGALRRLVRSI